MSPKIRQSIYLVGTVVSSLVGLALIWGGIDAGAAANIDSIVTGFGALVGGGVNATAATKVSAQRKDGTFEATSPLDAVVTNIPVVVAAATKAQADLAKLREVAADAAGEIPIYGAEAKAIIAALPKF